MRNKIVVVCGPTASGKTALSIRLAQTLLKIQKLLATKVLA